MQATCDQPGSLKWHISHSEDSALKSLPTELLVEIFQHLGWEGVLVMRRACKLFFAISTCRPLWVCLFYRLSSELRVPLILERPISAYTAADLEYVVMRRISSEIRWMNSATPRVRVLPTEWSFEEEDEMLLLEGGRWLLMCTRRNCWRVYAHDLDAPLFQEPRCIIDLEINSPTESAWLMDADVVLNNTSGLMCNLCLTPTTTLRPLDSPFDWAPDQIHIYRLSVKGGGTEAILEAHKLKSLHLDILAITNEADFCGNYLVRSLEHVDPSFYYFEVCNWLLSDSSVRFKSYIECDDDSDTIDDVMLIPDDKLIVISDSDISIYNISDLHPISTGEPIVMEIIAPYWKLTNLMLSAQFYYSIPYLEMHVTRVAIIMDGYIFGLTIPHKCDNNPSFQRISDVNFSDMPMICLGRNKIYAHDSNEGGVRTLNFLWPDDEAATRDGSLLLPAIAQPSQHQLCLPYRWVEEVPLFDDYSNRILSFADKSWVVADFGYKSSSM